MASLKLSTYANLMSALESAKAASDDVASEVHAHVIAHSAHLESLRADREIKKAIDHGIARSASQI